MEDEMQKFHMGDLVRVAKDLGESMSHFRADCEAIVLNSYADKFGGSDHKSYTLYFNGGGNSSWYLEHQLTLIEPGRVDKLKEWQDAAEFERRQKSDIDWIFENGEQVLDEKHGASLQALANCFGVSNLWGSRGEGIAYYHNAAATMLLAEPYLRAGDKAAWLARCDELKASLDKK